ARSRAAGRRAIKEQFLIEHAPVSSTPLPVSRSLLNERGSLHGARGSAVMKCRGIQSRRVRMGQSGFFGSGSRAGIAGAVLVLALAHCGSSSDKKGTSPEDGPLVDCQA